MKKTLVFSFPLLSSLSAVAAEGDPVINAPDFSGLVTQLSGWVTSFSGVLITVIAAFAGIWLLSLGWSVIKRVGNRAK